MEITRYTVIIVASYTPSRPSEKGLDGWVQGTRGTFWGGLSPLNFTIRGARAPVAPPVPPPLQARQDWYIAYI